MTTHLIELKSGLDTLRGIMTKSADSREVVVMFGGFERAGTTEKKFKTLSEKLGANNINCLRFDVADCGLSDGSFYDTTVEKMRDNLLDVVEHLRSLGYKNFSVVGHSLAACAISLVINQNLFDKIVLIAPALNQKDLLRLWFVQKNNKNMEIGWNNYRNYFNEDDFLKNLKFDLTTKTHKLNYRYREVNQDKDYSNNIPQDAENILLIHGQNDQVVPLESLNCHFINKLIIDKGDHDLEKPGVIEQWLDRAVDFIKNK